MLAKISDDLYLDLSEIIWVHKDGKDIRIRLRHEHEIIPLSVYTNKGKAFINMLDDYLGVLRTAKEK